MAGESPMMPTLLSANSEFTFQFPFPVTSRLMAKETTTLTQYRLRSLVRRRVFDIESATIRLLARLYFLEDGRYTQKFPNRLLPFRAVNNLAP